MPFVLLKVPFQQNFLVVWWTTQFQLLTMHKIQMNLIHLEKEKKTKEKKKEMKKKEKKKCEKSVKIFLYLFLNRSQY